MAETVNVGAIPIKDYSKSKNPIYRVELICKGHNLHVQMDMPEQLNLGVSSDFESRLTSNIADALNGITGGLTNKAGNLMGTSAHLQKLSFQMWTGTTPIEIPLTFLFDAEEDANLEVYQPIAFIQSVALPVNSGSGATSMLYGPGPRYGLSSRMGFFGMNTEGFGVDVVLGRMMIFKDCIMVSATATYDTRLDSRGFPMSGQLECTFRTPLVYGRADWMQAMQIPVDPSVIPKAWTDAEKLQNWANTGNTATRAWDFLFGG